MSLISKKCQPCEGAIPPLSKTRIKAFSGLIDSRWKILDGKRLQREFNFVNFSHTMDFVNRLARLAEDEGHHPVMHVFYGRCEVELWTHAINGLSENDFILAAKTDQLVKL